MHTVGGEVTQKQRTVRETALETELRAAQAELVRIRCVNTPFSPRQPAAASSCGPAHTDVGPSSRDLRYMVQVGPGPAAAGTRPSDVTAAAG